MPGTLRGRQAPVWTTVTVEPFARGLKLPTHVNHAGDGSGRLFVVEKEGRVRVLRDGSLRPTPFLDITNRVGSRRNEQGLLSVAFHPRYTSNGYFYLHYTDRRGDVVIARYQVSDADPDVANPESETVLLRQDKEASEHNGGLVAFGPDGYLYVGIGDGGRWDDPWDNAQDRSVLLGKMLRLDVDGGTPYAIPADNPFVNEPGARPEIWAYGLRNPWRFTFDPATGDLLIADVGQKETEEINLLPAGARGLNFGWSRMDGRDCYLPTASCDPSPYTLPIAEYDHSLGCAVVGGDIYHGAAFPSLRGIYFFADYCTGRIWGLQRTLDGSWERRELAKTGLTITSFGEDEAGELYLTTFTDHSIYRLVPAR
jgi:glucose/arabinose dehydrogenase